MTSLLKKVKTMLSATASATQPSITVEPGRLSGPHILDAKARNGYLAGQMLVATPALDTGCFQKSVVYVFAHNDEGAMGLIINQPLEMLSYASLLEGMDLPKIAADRDIPVFFGGPVERSRGFVIHSAEYFREFSLARGTELSITASSAILNDILEGKGPKHSALVVGYAGWSAGQLEAEIDANSWITVPASAELMFATDNELKWATAGKSLGIDIALMSTSVGHA